MKQKAVIISAAAAIILIVSAAAYGAYSAINAAPPAATFIAGNFTFANSTYNFTYIASSFPEMEAGLMNKTVTNTTFELFVFPDASIYPFWMKNTYYPLDIIWINGSTVTYIANATPCSWYSTQQVNCSIYNSYDQGHYANYVIEALSGFVNRTGLKVGDNVAIRLRS